MTRIPLPNNRICTDFLAIIVETGFCSCYLVFHIEIAGARDLTPKICLICNFRINTVVFYGAMIDIVFMVPVNEIKEAARFDTTLEFSNSEVGTLSKKYLPAKKFSRELLYDSMFNGRTVIFNDYPIDPGKMYTGNNGILSVLGNYLDRNEKIKIRAGAKRNLIKVTVEEALERWQRGRSRFGVTDLHFRDTRLFKKIDAGAISFFNMLPFFPYEVSFLEMLTLVISTKGIFSDSHSDDGDGSNHCFTGKKLWFAWDRREGSKAGLQDCTFDPVYDQAAFSIKKFLSLKSAHWFVISKGRTLFMPGNFTHKVITLEDYIGFGSFYVSFPNYFNSLRRWIFQDASDVTSEFIDVLNSQCIKYVKKIKNESPERQQELGFDYFLKGSSKFQKQLSQEETAIADNISSLKKLLKMS